MKKLVLFITLAAFAMLSLSVYGQAQDRPPSPPGQSRSGQDDQTRRLASNMPRLLVRLLDLDSDGKVSIKEYTKFFTDSDRNGDGSISMRDIMNQVSNRQKQMRKKEQEAAGPNLYEDAPDFALRTLDGKRIVKLSDFRGREPVVLVFGSYT